MNVNSMISTWWDLDCKIEALTSKIEADMKEIKLLNNQRKEKEALIINQMLSQGISEFRVENANVLLKSKEKAPALKCDDFVNILQTLLQIHDDILSKSNWNPASVTSELKRHIMLVKQKNAVVRHNLHKQRAGKKAQLDMLTPLDVSMNLNEMKD